MWCQLLDLQSDTLEFIDLSQNSPDKRAIEYIVQSIQPVPPSDGKPTSPTVNGLSHRGSQCLARSTSR